MRAKDDLAAAATPSDLAAPEFAATVFGAAEVKARLYADLLTTAGVERGLLGPQETSRVWSRHLFNCAAAAEFVPEVGSVADLGSGAGLPGVVLSLLRPQTDVLLIEPKLRRADFLHEVVGRLGLERTTVLRSRAEDVPGTFLRQFDVVAVRALAPLYRLVPMAMPLLRPGGRLVAIKGARAEAELAAAGADLRRSGARDARLHTVTAPWLTPPAVIITAVAGPGGPPL